MSAARLTLLLVLALGGVGCGREFYLAADRDGGGVRALDGATSGDALAVLPENNAQPIVAWHAPWAGLATISLDAFAANGDVEVHLLAEVGGTVEEIATRYLGLEAVPDAYGQVPEARSGADPLRLTASRAMSAGDAYFFYARVGDDDSNDVLIVHGSVGIAPTR